MPRVFIAYRRDDTGGHAGRVYDRLVSHWGRGHVTRDIEDIPPGIKFGDFVKQKIAESDCVLVLIGKRWMDAANRARLHDPADLHRVEIGTALREKRRVIPVLINGAPMPLASELPPELAELPELNAFSLDESGWDDDMRRLIRRIGGSSILPRRTWMGVGVAAAVALAAWLAVNPFSKPAPDGPAAGTGDSLPAAAADARTRFPAEERGPYQALVGLDTVRYYVQSDDYVRFADGWDDRNIVRVRVPQLAYVPGGPKDGVVLFHRDAAPALRQAWEAVERAGLLDRVQSWDGGYVPRVRRRTTRLSEHGTGLAFDINAGTNRLGAQPAAAGAPGSVRELVPIFEEHGFRWGGTFSVPDGNHFVWGQLPGGP